MNVFIFQEPNYKNFVPLNLNEIYSKNLKDTFSHLHNDNNAPEHGKGIGEHVQLGTR